MAIEAVNKNLLVSKSVKELQSIKTKVNGLIRVSKRKLVINKIADNPT
jgi:hypothetical protein